MVAEVITKYESISSIVNVVHFCFRLVSLVCLQEAGKQTSSDLWARVRKRERRRKGKFLFSQASQTKHTKLRPQYQSLILQEYIVFLKEKAFCRLKEIDVVKPAYTVILYTCAVLTFVFVAAVAHP